MGLSLSAVFIALLALLVAFCVSAPSAAEAATPSKKTIYSYSTWSSAMSHRTATVSDYDVTNDGKKDKVKIVLSGTNRDWYESLAIYVNGKKALSSKLGAFDCKIQLITLKNNKKFLYVESVENNQDGLYGVYRYTGGKFKSCFTDDIVKGIVHCSISSLKVSGNSVKATYTVVSYGTGVSKLSYTYKYKKGTLKRASSTADSYSAISSSKGKYTKGYFTCAKKINAKASASTKAKTKTLKKGTKVKITKMVIKNKTMWLKVKTKSGTSCWIKSPAKYMGYSASNPGGTYFKEAYMAG